MSTNSFRTRTPLTVEGRSVQPALTAGSREDSGDLLLGAHDDCSIPVSSCIVLVKDASRSTS